MTEYFAAASGGCFHDPQITASLSDVDLLLECLCEPEHAQLRTCNYFLFSGTAEMQWNPTFLAKLAYEGFFTITHQLGASSSTLPLPELQPMFASARFISNILFSHYVQVWGHPLAALQGFQ
jgi:hypothetical protein